MKNLITCLFLVFISSCSATDNTPSVLESRIGACQEAANTIFNKLDENSVKTLQETKIEDLIKFHFSWGMGIRNSLGLWHENSEIRKSCALTQGQDDIHPDQASTIIMEKVWSLVNQRT